jgi:hypothetical protein
MEGVLAMLADDIVATIKDAAKKIKETDAIFDNVERANREADEDA